MLPECLFQLFAVDASPLLSVTIMCRSPAVMLVMRKEACKDALAFSAFLGIAHYLVVKLEGAPVGRDGYDLALLADLERSRSAVAGQAAVAGRHFLDGVGAVGGTSGFVWAV